VFRNSVGQRRSSFRTGSCACPRHPLLPSPPDCCSSLPAPSIPHSSRF